MALSAGKQHSMAQQQGSVPIHYFFAKSHTHQEQNRGRKYYYTHIYKQIHSQLLTYDARNVLVNSLEGSCTNVLSVLWLTFHADQCAKLSSCSALTEIPGRVCIPVRVAGKPCSTLALRECVGMCGCVCVFPTICLSSWSCLICITSPTDSPASIKLPHILLDTFSSQVVGQVRCTNAVRRQLHVSD